MKIYIKMTATLLLIVISTMFIQHALVDFESAINTETISDLDQDYDQDGTTESNHSTGFLKIPVSFAFPEAVMMAIPSPVLPLIERPSQFDFVGLMLSDYILSLLRPPSV